MIMIIIIIITKELIRVTQSQLYNCYWGTVLRICSQWANFSKHRKTCHAAPVKHRLKSRM